MAGMVKLTVRNGGQYPVNQYAHRVAYAVFKRTIPVGMFIAHSIKCVGPHCCNPDHLRATSQSNNCKDKARAAKWRLKNGII